jgi:hypothetical protein
LQKLEIPKIGTEADTAYTLKHGEVFEIGQELLYSADTIETLYKQGFLTFYRHSDPRVLIVWLHRAIRVTDMRWILSPEQIVMINDCAHDSLSHYIVEAWHKLGEPLLPFKGDTPKVHWNP